MEKLIYLVMVNSLLIDSLLSFDLSDKTFGYLAHFPPQDSSPDVESAPASTSLYNYDNTLAVDENRSSVPSSIDYPVYNPWVPDVQKMPRVTWKNINRRKNPSQTSPNNPFAHYMNSNPSIGNYNYYYQFPELSQYAYENIYANAYKNNLEADSKIFGGTTDNEYYYDYGEEDQLTLGNQHYDNDDSGSSYTSYDKVSLMTDRVAQSDGIDELLRQTMINPSPSPSAASTNASTASENSTNYFRDKFKKLLAPPTGTKLKIFTRLGVPYGTLFGKTAWTLIHDYSLFVIVKLPDWIPDKFRHKRSLVAYERTVLYSLLEDFITNVGHDGQECLLRAICEAGEKPLEEYGILGELFSFLLAPGFVGDSITEDYSAAENYGLSHGGCWAKYDQCHLSLRELFYTGISATSPSL